MSGVRVAIVGAGGHGVVVADALKATGHEIVCFLETDAAKIGARLLDIPVIAEDQLSQPREAGELALANGIGGAGNTRIRRRVQEALESAGWTFLAVRHPSTIVSAHAVIEEGVQLLAGSVVQPGAHVGRGSIINTRSVVEHDCRVGAWSHIAPGAVLCGDVILNDGCLIGAGATVVPGCFLGTETIVGAGAVVTRDFEGHGILTGVPAKITGQGK